MSKIEYYPKKITVQKIWRQFHAFLFYLNLGLYIFLILVEYDLIVAVPVAFHNF